MGKGEVMWYTWTSSSEFRTVESDLTRHPELLRLAD